MVQQGDVGVSVGVRARAHLRPIGTMVNNDYETKRREADF